MGKLTGGENYKCLVTCVFFLVGGGSIWTPCGSAEVHGGGAAA